MDTITTKDLIIGLSIPFIGTTLGSLMVFFMKEKLSSRVEKGLMGFAAGIMIAASFWSLLSPALEMASQSSSVPWLSVSIGFLVGVFSLLLLDHLIPHLHPDSNTPEGLGTKDFKKSTMLFLAITLHNIPEGMAVGIVYAGVISNSSLITVSGALALSLGIAIQNFPEGAIVSMPLRASGLTKTNSAILGTLSGLVEPIAAIITIMLAKYVIGAMPFLLAFAAGAMIYVVADELLPSNKVGEHSHYGLILMAFGFVLMMTLDVALG